MTWRVTGTREKLYRVGTSADVLGWVDDEIEAMSSGWIPLSSESRPDGTLRVLYGRLPDEQDTVAPEGIRRPADLGSAGGAGWTAVVLLAVAALLTTFAVFASDL
jgi:hypothetical protein